MIKHLCCAALAASLHLSTPASAQGREVFSFGDSLSDTGNDAAVIGSVLGAQPDLRLYYRGMFSNGPVWVDLLGRSQARFPALLNAEISAHTYGVNLAHGGAESGAKRGSVANVVSYRRQVKAFRRLVRSRQVKIDQHDVFTVWIGANDYVASEPAMPVEVVHTIEEGVRDLIGLGAQTIIVANLPNLGLTPSSLTAGQDVAEARTRATREHNRYLAEAVDRLSSTTSARVILLDAESLFDLVIRKPELFGFTVVDRSCLSEGLIGDRCPEDWLFYDSLHPTYRAHAILSNMASELLEAD